MSTPPLTNGQPRLGEWTCNCEEGAAIRSCGLSRCPRCGMSRPDTAAIKKITDRGRMLLQALEEFDRMTPRVGRYQAFEAAVKLYLGEF